jgi:hypothetical protein
MRALKCVDLSAYGLEMRIAEFGEPVGPRVIVRGQTALTDRQQKAPAAIGFNLTGLWGGLACGDRRSECQGARLHPKPQ